MLLNDRKMMPLQYTLVHFLLCIFDQIHHSLISVIFHGIILPLPLVIIQLVIVHSEPIPVVCLLNLPAHPSQLFLFPVLLLKVFNLNIIDLNGKLLLEVLDLRLHLVLALAPGHGLSGLHELLHGGIQFDLRRLLLLFPVVLVLVRILVHVLQHVAVELYQGLVIARLIHRKHDVLIVIGHGDVLRHHGIATAAPYKLGEELIVLRLESLAFPVRIRYHDPCLYFQRHFVHRVGHVRLEFCYFFFF